MKVIKLEIEGFKRITVIEVTPKGNVVKLTGPNEAGKSSVLDAIMKALRGGRISAADVNKDSKNGGKIFMQLGEKEVEYELSKRISAKGVATLTIKTVDGEEIKSPQAFLDDLIQGGLAFDPLEFADMTKKEQLDLFTRLLGIDLDGLDQQIKDAEEERKYARKTKDEAAAVSQNLSGAKPVERVSVSETMQLWEKHKKNYKDAEVILQKRDDLRRAEVDDEDEVKDLEARLKEINKQQTRRHAEIAALPVEGAIQQMAASEVQVNDAKELLDAADDANNAADSYDKYKEAQAVHAKAKNKFTVAENQVEKLRATKKETIQGVEFPVEGLSVNDSELLIDDIPFDKLSEGAKIKTSLLIALALNPKCRVALLRNGSMLDDKNMKLVEQFAKKKDFQIWIETVMRGKSKPGEIVIEDGTTRS